MDDNSPRGDDEVSATLKRYDERISALEREVEGLKAGRTALAQPPALTTAQTAQTEAYAPAEHVPTIDNQVTVATTTDATATQPDQTAITTASQGETARAHGQTKNRKDAEATKSGGFPTFVPLIIGALVWYFSESFMIGGLAAVIASVVGRFIAGGMAYVKHKDEAAAQAAGTAHAATGEGGAIARGPRVKSNLEQNIGRYWYLWTGVCLLVVGLGYGLMLAYEHVGPLVKILSWFAGAAALVVAGEYAQRKMDFKQFGLALVGGGYAVGYFTIYAMQNIASVKIIDSVVVDSCLLLTLAAGCMLHSMYRKSESIALLAALLAFVTLSLSPVTSFTVVASAVMVVGLAAAIVYMRWFNVYLVGTVGSYLTFALFTQPQIASSVTGTEGFLFSAAFLTVHWLAYSAVLFLMRDPEGNPRDRSYSLGVSALNAAAFVGLALTAMGPELSDWRYLFLFAVGAAYFAFAYLAHSKRLIASQTLFMLIALMSATAAIPLWIDATAVSAVWLLEVPLLVVAGLALRQPAFRAFAAALAVFVGARLLMQDLVFGSTHTVALLGWSISWPVLIGIVGVIAFALAAVAYRLKAFTEAQHTVEKTVAYQFYFILASAVAWMIPAVAASAASQSLWFAFEGAVLLALAIKRSDKLSELASAVFFATSGVTLLLNHAAIGTIATYANVAVFFAASAFYKWSLPRRQDNLGYQFHHAYALAAVALTWALTIINNTGDMAHLALWLTLESAVVVAAGFALKDGVFRQLGGIGLAGAYVATIAGFTAWTWTTTLPVIAAFYAISFAYRYVAAQNAARPKSFADFVLALGVDETAFARFAYAVAGTLLVFAVTGSLASSHVELWWAAEAAIITAAGFALGDREWRYMGTIGFGAAALAVAASFGSWTWLTIIPAAALFYAASFAYRWLPLDDSLGQNSLINRHVPQFANERELLTSAFAIVGVLITTSALYVLLAWQWLAVAWSLEAIVLLTIGVRLNDKVFRYSAHAVFGLMLGKLVLWDLRGAEQYVRVITFIVAGVVSIAAAWIFARFEKKLSDEKNAAERAGETDQN